MWIKDFCPGVFANTWGLGVGNDSTEDGIHVPSLRKTKNIASLSKERLNSLSLWNLILFLFREALFPSLLPPPPPVLRFQIASLEKIGIVILYITWIGQQDYLSQMKVLYLCLIIRHSLLYGPAALQGASQTHIIFLSTTFCIGISDLADRCGKAPKSQTNPLRAHMGSC